MKHVVSATDDRYAQHLGVMLVSLLENTAHREEFRFHVIDAGIEEENKQRLSRVADQYGASIRFITFHSIHLDGIFVSRHINIASYLRLFMTDFLDVGIDRVLYLDSDVVVMKDIASLWDLNMDEYYLAAVDSTDLKRSNSLGLPPEAKYFNAGVLFINLIQWREGAVSGQFLSVIKEYKENLQYHDQDVLNIVLHDQWLTLQPGWNLRKAFFTLDADRSEYTRQQLDQAVEDPAIIHYTEASKPWHYLDNHPMKQAYYTYLEQSEWNGYIPPEKDAIDRLLRDKKIIIFGVGSFGKDLFVRLGELGKMADYFIDNDPRLWRTAYQEVPIHSPERLMEEDKERIFIFIASMYYEAISKQLEQMGFRTLEHYCACGFEHQLAHYFKKGDPT